MGSGSSDKARGRVEEAVGALTDDPELKRRGRVNQTAGKVKDATDKVVDAVAAAGVPRAVFFSSTALFTRLPAASKAARIAAEDLKKAGAELNGDEKVEEPQPALI